MPSTPVPQHLLDLLAKPNPAVMATVAADGRPVTVATWYLLQEDGTILLGLDAQRARLKHLEHDPRVSPTALDEANWGTHVSVQGRVTAIVDDEGHAGIDRIARHYIGQPYPDHERPRVLATMRIERWHGWSGGTAIER